MNSFIRDCMICDYTPPPVIEPRYLLIRADLPSRPPDDLEALRQVLVSSRSWGAFESVSLLPRGGGRHYIHFADGEEP